MGSWYYASRYLEVVAKRVKSFCVAQPTQKLGWTEPRGVDLGILCKGGTAMGWLGDDVWVAARSRDHEGRPWRGVGRNGGKDKEAE
jgi:hypothetical protein